MAGAAVKPAPFAYAGPARAHRGAAAARRRRGRDRARRRAESRAAAELPPGAAVAAGRPQSDRRARPPDRVARDAADRRAHPSGRARALPGRRAGLAAADADGAAGRAPGDPQPRDVGGSVAHADPRAELPVALLALGRAASPALAARRAERGRERVLPRPDAHRLAAGRAADRDRGSAAARRRAYRVRRARAHARRLRHRRGRHRARARARGDRTARRRSGSGPGAGGRARPARGSGRDEVAALAAEQVTDDYRRALVTALVARAIETARP